MAICIGEKEVNLVLSMAYLISMSLLLTFRMRM